MSELTIYELVYSQVFEHLPVYLLPEPWRGLSRGNDLRGAPADPAAVLSKLQERFTVEDLLKTKVAEVGNNDVLTMSPSLCDSQAVILGLRSSPDKAPFDLMVDPGCLSRRLLPICAVLGDGRMRDVVTKWNRPVCVTFSMVDAAILLSLGFPSAVAGGLEGAGRLDLELFRRCFQLDTRQKRPMPVDILVKEKNDSPWWLLADVLQDSNFHPPEICLVGWSVAELDRAEPEGLPGVLTHLDSLGRHMGLTLEDFSIWRPSQEEVSGIGFCVEHGCRTDVRDAILQSLGDTSRGLSDTVFKKPPKDLAEALGHFQDVLSQRDADKGQEQLAWQECQQVVHRELIAPLFAQAEAVADPVERSYCVAAANVAQLVHTQGMALKSKMMKQGRQSSAAALSRDEVQTLMSMTDRLLKLGKELRECGTQPIWKLGK